MGVDQSPVSLYFSYFSEFLLFLRFEIQENGDLNNYLSLIYKRRP